MVFLAELNTQENTNTFSLEINEVGKILGGWLNASDKSSV